MIIILNLTPYTLTDTERDQVVASIVAQGDPRFAAITPKARILDVPRRGGTLQTVAAIPLTPEQWIHYAVIPFILPDQVDAQGLLDEINARRGHDVGVVVRRGMGDWGA